MPDSWLHLGNWWRLGIGILLQIGVLICSASINPAGSVKCMLKLCMVNDNYALSSWVTEQKLDLKIICC